MQSRKAFLLILGTGYITAAAVALNIMTHWSDGRERWIVLALIGLFCALLTGAYFARHRSRLVHGALALEVLTIFAVVLIQPRTAETIFILLFVISGCATILLPLSAAIPWIVGPYTMSLVAAGLVDGWPAVIGWLTAAGGHTLFAAFGYLVRRSDASRKHTERLLAELQTAHAQLQQYAAQSQRLAVAEERNRLAREMHDTLGHRLTVAVLQLEGAQRLIPTNPERAATTVGAMRSQIKEALAEVRRAVATLRTDEDGAAMEAPEQLLPEQSLRQEIVQLAQTFQEATGLPVQVTAPAELPALAPAQRLALYRAAQESLTNVQRHAAASQAWLALQVAEGAISLTVTDNGRGMPTTIDDGRFGLRGLGERARQLGGQFQVEPRPDGGAQVCFTLPLNGDDKMRG